MDPHPDFATCDLPREAELDTFRLSPLAPPHLEEDFEAVTASAPVLAGLFGDWPAGLTREDNLVDLAWHEREFTLRRSFAWIVRSPEGPYLGCAYLFPAPGARGSASVCLWIRDRSDRRALIDRLEAELAAWFAGRLPGNVALTWHRPTAV